MTNWVKAGLVGAVLSVGAAAGASGTDRCAEIQAAYAEGLKLPAQVMYGTHGSVTIAPDGTSEMVTLYREARALGCEGFPSR